MPVISYDEFSGIRVEFKKHLADTFCVKAAAYMSHYHWNTETFQARTGLSNNTHNMIVNGKLKPTKRTAVAFCVGLALDYRMAVDLLDSAGCSLSLNNQTDEAYDYLLSEMRGETIEACNAVLQKRGVPPLGSQERNTDRIGKVKIT